MKAKLGPKLAGEINEIFKKSDDFKGLIFVKCSPVRIRDAATHRIQSGKFRYDDHVLGK